MEKLPISFDELATGEFEFINIENIVIDCPNCAKSFAIVGSMVARVLETIDENTILLQYAVPVHCPGCDSVFTGLRKCRPAKEETDGERYKRILKQNQALN